MDLRCGDLDAFSGVLFFTKRTCDGCDACGAVVEAGCRCEFVFVVEIGVCEDPVECLRSKSSILTTADFSEYVGETGRTVSDRERLIESVRRARKESVCSLERQVCFDEVENAVQFLCISVAGLCFGGIGDVCILCRDFHGS